MTAIVPRPLARAALAALLFVTIPRSASSQGTARSMDIDVSIRSAALGGASNAVFWGDELDHWGNPALLGNVDGLHYEHGRTSLVPGLATDVLFVTDVVKLGGGGLGVVLSDRPMKPAGVRLDYGSSLLTDQNGNVVGIFAGGERVWSWGAGVDVLEALGNVPGTGGALRRLSRWGDVAFGMNFKEVLVDLGGGEAGRTRARDWGILARVTPFDGIGRRGGLPLRLDLGYGHSVLSSNDDARILFPGATVSDPVSRHRRDGWGARLAFDPPDWPPGGSGGAWGLLLAGLHPLVSVGTSVDRARVTAGPEGGGYRTEGEGLEIGLARVLALRTGHFRDRLGGIDGETWGWGTTLPLGPWGGVTYEEAWFPQARDAGLPRVHRRGWSAWLAPLAIGRSSGGRGSTGDRMP